MEEVSWIEFITVGESALFPNNHLPVIFYKQPWQLPFFGSTTFVMDKFASCDWVHAWKADIFDYHHYHSTAHEVLGAVRGECQLQLGGDEGAVIEFEKGDVLVIPAGVAHKKVGGTTTFQCVGAYPKGQFYDMNYGTVGERPQVDRAVAKVCLPEQDPVFGTKGPLIERWVVR